MSYLINSLITFFLILPAPLMGAKNPFSVNFESEPLKLQGELRQTIKVSIRSNSIEDTKYYLKLSIPKTHMAVLEGRDSYTGDLGPLKSKDHYITVRLKREGEGRLVATTYGYMDDREVDMDDPSSFVADYSISKSTKTTGKDYLLSIASTNEQTQENVEQDLDKTTTSSKLSSNEEDASQRFILGSKGRDNGFLRSLLFVFSFFLIAWFAYRIINKLS